MSNRNGGIRCSLLFFGNSFGKSYVKNLHVRLVAKCIVKTLAEILSFENIKTTSLMAGIHKVKSRSYGFIGGGLEIMGTPLNNHKMIIYENESPECHLCLQTTDSDGVLTYR